MVILSRALTPPQRSAARSAALQGLLGTALGSLGMEARTLNCRLAGPAEVRRLNRRFAGVDRPTDVLAFPARDTRGGAGFVAPAAAAASLGDVVISVEDAGRQAPGGWEDELRLLAVHGLLHLIGHDHHEGAEADAMARATREILGLDARRRGVPPPEVPDLVPSSPS